MQILPTIIKNGILGDGAVSAPKDSVGLTFISSDTQSLRLKERMVRELVGEDIKITYRDVKSGYGGRKKVKSMYVQKFPITGYEILREEDLLDRTLRDITELDIFLWYLDDGSWHKVRNTMHLYSNMLTEEQSHILIDRIEELYGIPPSLRIDRKKDGREFYYLYFPRKLVNILHPIFKSYITALGLSDSYYKVGGLKYVDKPHRKVIAITNEIVEEVLESDESSRELAKSVGCAYTTIQRIRRFPEKYIS